MKSHCPIAKFSLWRHELFPQLRSRRQSHPREPVASKPPLFAKFWGLNVDVAVTIRGYQLKRPSYKDMSSYTKLYITRYTLAYYAHLCTSMHYVHHLPSGAVSL